MTKFEERAITELERAFKKAKNGESVDPLKLIRKLKELFYETLTEEFTEQVGDSVNVATKRKLYGAPDKSLNLFTVVESRRRPVGYFISLKLSRTLPENTEIKQLFSQLNILSLNAYNYRITKEICGEQE